MPPYPNVVSFSFRQTNKQTKNARSKNTVAGPNKHNHKLGLSSGLSVFSPTRMVTTYWRRMAENPDACMMSDAHSLSSKGGENLLEGGLQGGGEKGGKAEGSQSLGWTLSDWRHTERRLDWWRPSLWLFCQIQTLANYLDMPELWALGESKGLTQTFLCELHHR